VSHHEVQAHAKLQDEDARSVRAARAERRNDEVNIAGWRCDVGMSKVCSDTVEGATQSDLLPADQCAAL